MSNFKSWPGPGWRNLTVKAWKPVSLLSKQKHEWSSALQWAISISSVENSHGVHFTVRELHCHLVSVTLGTSQVYFQILIWLVFFPPRCWSVSYSIQVTDRVWLFGWISTHHCYTPIGSELRTVLYSVLRHRYHHTDVFSSRISMSHWLSVGYKVRRTHS